MAWTISRWRSSGRKRSNEPIPSRGRTTTINRPTSPEAVTRPIGRRLFRRRQSAMLPMAPRHRGSASLDDDASQSMTRRGGDGAGLLAAFRAAVDNLAARVVEVNALNVFPVPDGDTGTNMLAFIRAALVEAEAGAD